MWAYKQKSLRVRHMRVQNKTFDMSSSCCAIGSKLMLMEEAISENDTFLTGSGKDTNSAKKAYQEVIDVTNAVVETEKMEVVSVETFTDSDDETRSVDEETESTDGETQSADDETQSEEIEKACNGASTDLSYTDKSTSTNRLHFLKDKSVNADLVFMLVQSPSEMFRDDDCQTHFYTGLQSYHQFQVLLNLFIPVLPKKDLT